MDITLLFCRKKLKINGKDMFKRIVMYQGDDFNFFEAVFSWGSIFAFTMEQLIKELKENRVNLN